MEFQCPHITDPVLAPRQSCCIHIFCYEIYSSSMSKIVEHRTCYGHVLAFSAYVNFNSAQQVVNIVCGNTFGLCFESC